MSDQGRLLGTSTRRRVGATEKAAEKTLARWRDRGNEVDELASSQLRGAARDVDEALDDYRHDRAGLFTVTRARALLRDLYGDLRPADRPAETDPFAQALEQILAEQ